MAASLLISYVIMSALVWIVMLDLAEMTSYMPIKSLTVPYLVDRFVDKSLAFATGTCSFTPSNQNDSN